MTMSDISGGGENPSEASLKLIREWSHEDFAGLMEFVRDIWNWPEFGFDELADDGDAEVFELHTGGWSGNEEIIGALQDNGMFWSMCWESSRRGGHYIFKVRKTR